jgi:hypothetical protein
MQTAKTFGIGYIQKNFRSGSPPGSGTIQGYIHEELCSVASRVPVIPKNPLD